jgi:hypothetical protein
MLKTTLNLATGAARTIARTVTGGGSETTRSEAAQKAAATRKRDAAKRSATAEKAAQTRKANAAKRSATAKKAATTRKQRDARVEAMVEATRRD